MNACHDWLAREFLVRVYTGRGARLTTPVEVEWPDGRTVAVPAPCGHDPQDCPPLPADLLVAV